MLVPEGPEFLAASLICLFVHDLKKKLFQELDLKGVVHIDETVRTQKLWCLLFPIGTDIHLAKGILHIFIHCRRGLVHSPRATS